MPSFTQRFNDLLRTGAIIDISLGPAKTHFDNIEEGKEKQIKLVAMIDTGANVTVIKEGIAKILELKSIGTISITTPLLTEVLYQQFEVQLIFPDDVVAESVVVAEAPLQNQHIQCLIGRDVLQHAVFIYNGHDNSFTLSF